MFVFGSGVLIGTPSSGTPVNFGLVQEVSLDINITNKELFGQYAFPVAIGQGTRKLNGKAKLAKLSGLAIGQLFFGVTPVAGSTLTAFGETGTVPSSPYQITVTNHSTFVADQGVLYASSGLPLTHVASLPAQGQYSVSGGVYTFAAADVGVQMLISYTYTSSSTGENVPVSNPLLGPPSMIFQANLFASDPTVSNRQFSVLLYNCIAQKLSFGTKIEDFIMPEFDFQIFANSAGQVMNFNFGDAA